MKRNLLMGCLSLPAAALATMLSAGSAMAVPVTVPNHSFEFPSVAAAQIPALPLEFIPLLFPPGTDANWVSDGPKITLDQNFPPVVPVVLFPNVPANDPNAPSARITNLDGEQGASMSPLGGVTLKQLLSDTFQVGASYSLTAGFSNSAFQGPVEGSALLMEFFFLDAQMQDVVVGSLSVLASELAATTLTDKALTLPIVTGNDPWAGQRIGIRFVGVPGDNPQTTEIDPGGFMNVDNVRLEAVGRVAEEVIPEPATMTGLALAFGAAMLRRRRLA